MVRLQMRSRTDHKPFWFKYSSGLFQQFDQMPDVFKNLIGKDQVKGVVAKGDVNPVKAMEFSAGLRS